MLIAFNKPFAVLSQFNSDQSPNRTLAEFGFPPGVYPVGRLDADSEGLLILSDQPEWNARLLRPGKGHEREYWVQVEGVATAEKLQRLSTGVVIQGRAALPCVARALEHPPETCCPCLGTAHQRRTLRHQGAGDGSPHPIEVAALGCILLRRYHISVSKMVTLCGRFCAYFATLDVIHGWLPARSDSPCSLR